MKKTAVLVLLVAAMLSQAFAQYPSMVLKLGHIADPSHPYAQGAVKFSELVKQKTGGKVDIQVFASSQLGDQKTLIEGLIYGTIDMALVGTAALTQFQPQMGIFDLPFLFDDRDHAYRSLDTVGMDIGKALEPKGIKLLGYMENGIRHLTNNVREVKTPDDMKGLKIRVQTSKIFIEMMKALGASPTPMSLDELYSAMQSGTVDGQENPSAHIYTQRYYEVQKYASLTAHAYAPEPVLISMAKWKSLPAAVQKAILDSAAEAIAWQRELSAKSDQELWDKIKATGKMKVTEVNRKPFQDATAKVIEMFADSVGRDNLKKINDLRKK
ncbi:MAG: DctP family TRAP transporter solute-binding subunit [Spirochaetia bacterium]|nr:DctP family TRAP transporter solute-binding subunit [Spirochaetia bacterium]